MVETMNTSPEEIIHATTVAHLGRAVMIRGRSGSGKSGLALQLLALGAELVADDRTRIWAQDSTLMSDVPETIRGQIEARGVGILAAPNRGPTRVFLIVDLDQSETKRLPQTRYDNLHGIRLPLLHRADFIHFPSAILLYLKHGRVD
ncbi:HPr kinase/phosphorylase [Roseovarius albus]|uniref:HPr kinase/phosphorylase n=1 Tax=Roseovarius albus TaxID=1247867 RepID=A0A1X6ZIF2_9RHOB|nr:serine kinase [Roseovarius albus]SLN52670.1 HPr kinase/phosphorylase [Roseovarius albus]